MTEKILLTTDEAPDLKDEWDHKDDDALLDSPFPVIGCHIRERPESIMYDVVRPIEGVPDKATLPTDRPSVIHQRDRVYFQFMMPHEYKVGVPDQIALLLPLPIQLEVGDDVVLCEDFHIDNNDPMVYPYLSYRADCKIADRCNWNPASEMDPANARWAMTVEDIQPEQVDGRWVVHYIGPVRRRE